MIYNLLRKIDNRLKKYLLVFLCLSLFIGIVSIVFYKDKIVPILYNHRAVVTCFKDYSSEEEFPDINLNKEKVVEQKFIMPTSHIDGMSIYLNNAASVNDGELRFELYNLNKKNSNVVNQYIKLKNLRFNGYNYIDFKKILKVKAGDEYAFKITSVKDSKDELIINKSKPYSISKTLKTNNKNDNGMICFQINYGTIYSIKYIFFAIVFILILALFFSLLTIYSGYSLEKKGAILAFIFGLIMIMIIPPYLVPDEISHYATAYRDSSIIMGKNKVDKDGSVIADIQASNYMIDDHATPNANNYVNYYKGLLGKNEKISAYKNKFILKSALSFKSLSYFPQVIGLTISRILNLNSYLSYTLSRILALIVYVSFLYFAMKLLPFGKMIMFAVAILPMSIHQAASFSYDSIVMAASFLLTAYIINLIYVKDKIGFKEILINMLLLVLMIPVKPMYCLIILLWLLIPNNKFSKKAYKYLILLGFVLFSLFIFRFTRYSLIGIVSNTNNGRISGNVVYNYYSIPYCLNHIKDTIKLFINTIIVNTNYYFNTLVGGYLGWLNITMETIYVVMYSLIIFMSLGNNEDMKGNLSNNTKFKFLSFTIFIVACLSIFVSLLIGWTVNSAKIIEGIQGRYFLPVLPLLLFACKFKQLRIINIKSDIIYFTFSITMILSSFQIFRLIVKGIFF